MAKETEVYLPDDLGQEPQPSKKRRLLKFILILLLLIVFYLINVVLKAYIPNSFARSLATSFAITSSIIIDILISEVET